jgi:hypothetical protein
LMSPNSARSCAASRVRNRGGQAGQILGVRTNKKENYTSETSAIKADIEAAFCVAGTS